MKSKFTKAPYPVNWKEIADTVKEIHNWKCERCGRGHLDPATGYTLTVHHLDGDPANNKYWNLACLCQRCHLKVQGKVFLPQSYMFEHSEWFKPHIEGYYKNLIKRRIIRTGGGD